MFAGMAERINMEVSNLIPTGGPQVNVKAASKNLVWQGASLLAAQSSFEASWITQDEYWEYGPSIVHRKCA